MNTLTRAPDLLNGPMLLLRFALPNMVAMLAAALAAVAETHYVGQLGAPALAGMALVFPFVMLQNMLSAGATDCLVKPGNDKAQGVHGCPDLVHTPHHGAAAVRTCGGFRQRPVPAAAWSHPVRGCAAACGGRPCGPGTVFF